ncbi:MAG: NADAR family protein [Planctomycetota bacterium]|nr:NADAR family protein [Planctomycetota bacterium]
MSSLPLNRAELISRTVAGESFQYFFWGHTPPKDGGTSKSCLSQWFPAPFRVEGITYKTAEHWMMGEKARLFGDADMLRQIIESESPKDAKALGRKVQNFDANEWGAKCFEIVVNGNVEKFQQNPAMMEFLLSTGDTVLVEAAARDQIWGIGLGEHLERARDPSQWRGRNMLGFALVEVRTRLRAE